MAYSTGMQGKRVAVFNPSNNEKAFGRERTFEYAGTFWMAEDFNRGNSAISFIGFYMLARYVRLHTSFPQYSAKFHFICYF